MLNNNKDKYDYIRYSTAYNAKNVNGYICKGDYYELHITDLASNDKIFMISASQYVNCRKYFWISNKIGRVDNQQEQVYTYIKRKKMYLNRLITGITEQKDKKVIFKNRDCFDYRDENLYVTSKNGKYFKDKPVKGKELPSGIFLIKHKDNKETGYKVKNNKGKETCFGIREFKTLDICLQEAKKYLDSLKFN